MKKYFYILAAAAIALSCSKVNNDVSKEDEFASNKISFTARVEKATKASVSATEFKWQAGDAAAVYSDKGVKVLLYAENISGAVATFSGDVPTGDFIPENALVVYPGSLLTAPGKVTFPDSYYNTVGAEGPALAAKVVSNNLDFKYLAGSISITVEDVPAIAEKILVSVRNADDTQDIACTGTYSVDFSGNTPALTEGANTSSSVSESKLVYGENRILIPLTTLGEQKVTVAVKYGENNLISRSITLKGEQAVTRAFYGVAPALRINPEVHIIGDRIGWDADESTKAVVGENFIGTREGFTVLGKRYFRAKVKYGDLMVDYGYESEDQNGAEGGYFSPGCQKAAYLPFAGVYNISFNYVNESYNVERTEIAPLYMIGINGNWNFDNSQPMTAIPFTNLLVWKGTTSTNEFKVYEYGINNWNEKKYIYSSSANNNWTGNIKTEEENGPKAGQIKCGISTDPAGASVIFNYRNMEHKTYIASNEANSVELRGSFDGWKNGTRLNKYAEGSRIWYISGMKIENDAQVKFVENGNWYGNGLNMADHPDWGNLAGGDNMTLPAGTYTICYIDENHSYHIFKY